MSTLSQLRDRIRTQVQAATGWIEPLLVAPSTIQLASQTPNLRDRVKAVLQDASADRWSTDDLDEAIRRTLELYSDRNPHQAIVALTLESPGREIDLSTIPNLARVEKVWWDYNPDDPGSPPNWRHFEVWPGAILYIDDEDQPAAGDVVRIWYTTPHTLNGLDGAEATTIPVQDVGALVVGAAALAAQSRAIELAEELNVDRDVVDRLTAWADTQLKSFRAQIRQDLPAWQRRAYAYTQDDLDEAIRWALARLNEIAPNVAEHTLTLVSDSREIDISALAQPLDVIRVWSPYQPGPPEWRDFEVWPGDILYIHDARPPAAGDAIRLFYTTPHTIAGLDGAAAATLRPDDENLIVVGASAFAAQERGMEEPGYYTNTRLRYWSEARLKEFDRGLRALARRNAARDSGLAPGPPLDRWGSPRT